MVGANPHFPVRQKWLALNTEDVIDPDLPIFDCHDHLWDRMKGFAASKESLA